MSNKVMSMTTHRNRPYIGIAHNNICRNKISDDKSTKNGIGK